MVPGVAAVAGEAGGDVAVPAAGLVAAGLVVAGLPELPELHPVKINPASTATTPGMVIVRRFIGPLLLWLLLLHRPGKAGRLRDITHSCATAAS